MKIIFSTFLVLLIKFNGLTQPVEFFRTYDLGDSASPTPSNIKEINKILYINGTIKQPNQKIFLFNVNIAVY